VARFPKLFDRGSLKRTGIAVAALAAVLGLVYWYQPQRYDLFKRKPKKPVPRIPIEDTGLFEPGKRLVIVTAHPDDEAFYLGGTLYRLKASGARITLLVLTDGDKAYYPFFDSEPLRKTRREEVLAVAREIGIEEVLFFGYPDGRLSFDETVTKRVAKEIEKRNPDLVLAFDPYFWPRASHRDHRVAGENTQAALREIAFTGCAMFFSTVAANTYSDVDKTWNQAQELLALHKSQFYGKRLEFIRGMVSDRAVDAGEFFGAGFAEPFRAVLYQEGRSVISDPE